MKLYINTANSEKIVISLDEKEFSTDSRKEKSQRLLPFISEVLQKEGGTPKDIDEIEVFTGPGSFTGLRVGVSVANALGWALNVPVNGKKVAEGTIQIQYK
jgi:tRNA threonylcarbamoyladenosine biosynthesis protein TsaB